MTREDTVPEVVQKRPVQSISKRGSTTACTRSRDLFIGRINLIKLNFYREGLIGRLQAITRKTTHTVPHKLGITLSPLRFA